VEDRILETIASLPPIVERCCCWQTTVKIVRLLRLNLKNRSHCWPSRVPLPNIQPIALTTSSVWRRSVNGGFDSPRSDSRQPRLNGRKNPQPIRQRPPNPFSCKSNDSSAVSPSTWSENPTIRRPLIRRTFRRGSPVLSPSRISGIPGSRQCRVRRVSAAPPRETVLARSSFLNVTVRAATVVAGVRGATVGVPRLTL